MASGDHEIEICLLNRRSKSTERSPSAFRVRPLRGPREYEFRISRIKWCTRTRYSISSINSRQQQKVVEGYGASNWGSVNRTRHGQHLLSCWLSRQLVRKLSVLLICIFSLQYSSSAQQHVVDRTFIMQE